MTSSLDHVREILSGTIWEDAKIDVMSQDASTRLYYRLETENGSPAVLMDSSADHGALEKFLTIGKDLREMGFSAPEVLFEARSSGAIVIEDFGNARFADLPTSERELYQLGVDVLTKLHRCSCPNHLPICDDAHLGALASTAWTEYAGLASFQAEEISEIVKNLSQELCLTGDVFMLRDYHAENLMWLPAHEGIARAGLLDFQDAMRSHPAFDLVSLLQDARRDLSDGLEDAMIARYLSGSSVNEEKFRAAYAALGAIRNLRIIGVFARLARNGRPAYLEMLPRVWKHLATDLAHPALTALSKRVDQHIPSPSRDHINSILKHD